MFSGDPATDYADFAVPLCVRNDKLSLSLRSSNINITILVNRVYTILYGYRQRVCKNRYGFLECDKMLLPIRM